MSKIPEELKKAILKMPQAEKDKILLRLIGKDELLIAKLNHQLLEDEVDTENQKQEILKNIREIFSDERNRHYFYTPGLLMMGMRDWNGNITHHVKITKDKFGEIELTLTLVNIVFENYAKFLHKEQKKADTFAEYVVKRADFVLKKLQKIEEDYYMDFAEEVNKMLNYIANYQPCNYMAKELKLPKIWEW